jgi:hypothetical protein
MALMTGTQVAADVLFGGALALVVACGSSKAVEGTDAGTDGDYSGDAASAGGDATSPPSGHDATFDTSSPEDDGTTSEGSSTLDAAQPWSDVVDAPTDLAFPDASADSGYALCGNGIDPSLKVCTSDADCTIAQHTVNCCRAILYAGVAKASSQTFAQCEAAWVVHLPRCGCFSNAVTTEDGKCVSGYCAASADAAATVAVHCARDAGETGNCETSLP